MCNAVKHRVQLVAPELKGGLLPSKNRLALLRKQMKREASSIYRRLLSNKRSPNNSRGQGWEEDCSRSKRSYS